VPLGVENSILLVTAPGIRNGVIRQVLESCEDNAPPTSSKDLLFVKDPAVRSELLADWLLRGLPEVDRHNNRPSRSRPKAQRGGQSMTEVSKGENDEKHHDR
jgi:hypothetical protein